MSLLSNKIEELIADSGETVQSLAEMGNISRTTLQRVKSGERLPPKKFFKSLCKALRLSPAEEEELKILLEIATVGERVYFNRRKIIELIETISELTEYRIPFSKEIKMKEETQKINSKPDRLQIFTGECEVLKIVQNSIDKELFFSEKPQLKLAIPYDCEEIYQYIFQQMMGNQKNLFLQDVINLPGESDETTVNKGLSALKYLIALSLLDNVEYQSNYYYQTTQSSFEHRALFPYFILTSQCVITLSGDLKIAVLHQDGGLLELYQDGYIKMLEHVESFILESSDLFQIYALEQTAKSKQVIEPLPCFAYYFTPELLKKKINKNFPNHEVLFEAAIEFYGNFQKENQSMINIFTFKNLQKFMLDGSLYFPDEVCLPFTPDERLMMVKRLREDLVNDKRKIYAVNEEKIFLNSSIEFVNEYTSIRLVLHYRNNKKLVFKTIVLQEESILNAFDEFLNSLPGSEYVLPTEKTIEELDAIIGVFEKR